VAVKELTVDGILKIEFYNLINLIIILSRIIEALKWWSQFKVVHWNYCGK